MSASRYGRTIANRGGGVEARSWNVLAGDKRALEAAQWALRPPQLALDVLGDVAADAGSRHCD